ncbi:DEAD/DEAH box helicase [Prosthecochloris sp. GSB1]|uniref:DEAD/DEAH box helicase n=1 Tax=Prosthecochloris sp. GSB1 TaxID=281093 RepID=UPI000B8CECB8|nr:DEAD/DEAH box helicase [Prosthecochloris sp. GSB1]ASQ90115.1 DEAD/DEAH box helicase [Prosthecochloris sp. GSB1]
MGFTTLDLIDPIARALREEGYAMPTPIQAEAIPHILQGSDLLGCAQTGTGKTAAFAIPVLQLLDKRKTFEKKRRIRALVVTPTRELAIQIGDSFTAYGRHTGLTNLVIFGGVGQTPQTNALRNGVDILVATPGRLLDLMGQGYLTLKDIEILVLDEADRMLDMGFIHDIRKILKALPEKKQSLFFSATMPPEIVRLAGTILKNPAKVTVTPVSSTVDTISQQVYFVDKGNKKHLLVHLLKDAAIESVLVFTRTKHGADKVVRFLQKHRIRAEAIHGNKGQNARQRALGNFRDRSTRVLVATDIAARGIDVDDLEYVINYDMSNVPETYVHRIGRTGRAGAKGTAISFCDAEEKAWLRDVEKLISKKIPEVDHHPYPLTDDIPVPAPVRQGRGGEGRSAQGRPSAKSNVKRWGATRKAR